MKLRILLLLSLLVFGCVEEEVKDEVIEEVGGDGMVDGKVLFVIAPSDFRDEELFDTKSAVEEAGCLVVIASTSKDEAKGMLGGSAKPDILVEEANVDEYKAVVFIGGIGVEKHLLYENDAVLSLAKSAYEKGKVVGAICIAPRILAKAGLLDGKKVTAFGDATTRSMLSAAKATFTDSSVEQDGEIITANGPEAAKEFGERIAGEISKEKAEEKEE